MITYEKQEIFKVKIDNNYKLEDETLDLLRKIDNIISKNVNTKKDNNDSGNNWRMKKQSAVEKRKKNLSQNELVKGELNGNLNKITISNFNSLSVKILNQIKDSKDLAEYVVDNIFKKAVVQPIYCVSYVKLIKLIIDKGFDVKISITNKCDQYTTLLKKEEISTEDKNLNYDEFCDLMSEKKYKVGYSQFIGELYNNELMDYHVFAKNIFAFFESLETLLKIPNLDMKDPNVENTIICICSLIETSLKGIKSDDIEFFKNKLTEFNSLKRYQRRLQFKILDLIEKI